MFLIPYYCSNPDCSFSATLAKYQPQWYSWVPQKRRKVPPPAHLKDELVEKRVDDELCGNCGSTVEIDSEPRGNDSKNSQCPICKAQEAFIEKGNLCPFCQEGHIYENENFVIKF